MSHDTTERPSENSLQGMVVRPVSQEELLRVMEWAFDYRGDVTLELKTQPLLCGYVCNRVRAGLDSYLEMLQPDGPGLLKIFYRDIQGVRFTGQDTASGQSWEAWVQKKQQDRKS